LTYTVASCTIVSVGLSKPASWVSQGAQWVSSGLGSVVAACVSLESLQLQVGLVYAPLEVGFAHGT